MKKNLLLFLIATLFFACSENKVEDLPPKTELHLEFSKNKTISEQKEIFKNLPYSQQKNLWLSKFNEVKKEVPNNISQPISIIIEELENSIEVNSILKSEKVQSAVVQVSMQISPEGFLEIFTNLDSFRFSNNMTNVDTEYYKSIQASFENNIVKLNGESSNSRIMPRRTCDCKWTCGIGPALCVTSDCKPTSSGCGLLWLSSCKKRNVIDGGESC